MSCLILVQKLFPIMCSVNLEVKMAKLQLGVSAKATILVSHMHLKDMISRAHPNYMKMDKIEGLIVVLETSKPIHCEEKVVVVFHHPPKGDQTEEFDCWVLHPFVHVTEEGPEEGLFSASNGGGDTNSGSEQATQPALNNTEDPLTNPRKHPNRSGNHFGLCRCHNQ